MIKYILLLILTSLILISCTMQRADILLNVKKEQANPRITSAVLRAADNTMLVYDLHGVIKDDLVIFYMDPWKDLSNFNAYPTFYTEDTEQITLDTDIFNNGTTPFIPSQDQAQIIYLQGFYDDQRAYNVWIVNQLQVEIYTLIDPLDPYNRQYEGLITQQPNNYIYLELNKSISSYDGLLDNLRSDNPQITLTSLEDWGATQGSDTLRIFRVQIDLNPEISVNFHISPSSILDEFNEPLNEDRYYPIVYSPSGKVITLSHYNPEENPNIYDHQFVNDVNQTLYIRSYLPIDDIDQIPGALTTQYNDITLSDSISDISSAWGLSNGMLFELDYVIDDIAGEDEEYGEILLAENSIFYSDNSGNINSDRIAFTFDTTAPNTPEIGVISQDNQRLVIPMTYLGDPPNFYGYNLMLYYIQDNDPDSITIDINNNNPVYLPTNSGTEFTYYSDLDSDISYAIIVAIEDWAGNMAVSNKVVYKAPPVIFVDDAPYSVDPSATMGSKNNPYTNLQQAMDQAHLLNLNDGIADNIFEVKVAGGTYTPYTNDTDYDISQLVNQFLQPYADLHILGGYSSDFSTRNEISTIDGTGSQHIISTWTAYYSTNKNSQIFGIAEPIAPNGNTLLDGFTLENGSCNDSSGGGGAIYMEYPFEINNCIFINNSSYEYSAGSGGKGGAIYYPYAGNPLTITNSNFIGNRSQNQGAAISSANTLYLTNCYFEDNQSTSGSAGAIYFNGNNAGESLNIMDSSFIRNIAAYNGGAIYIEGGNAIIENSQFGDGTFENTNVASSTSGGAIFSYRSLEISNCTFDYNISGSGGAVYFEGTDTDTIIINNSEFYRNQANNGGALYLSNGDADVFTSNFGAQSEVSSGNSAFTGNGGAIYFSGGGLLNVGNNGYGESRFHYNNSILNGGAIYLDMSSNLTFDQTWITYNSANQHGGAIFANTGSNLFIAGQQFQNNSADNDGNYLGDGGAIYLIDGNITINDYVNFQSNNASNGGAIYSVNSTLFIDDNIGFNNNMATSRGGGIYVDASTSMVITNQNSFNGNSAGDNGGALFISNSTNRTFKDLRFDNNTALINGGAMCLIDSTNNRLINNFFYSNHADNDDNSSGSGGAIFQSNSTLWSIQNFFVENSADNGGAIYQELTSTTTGYHNLYYNNSSNSGLDASILGGTFIDNSSVHYSNLNNTQYLLYEDGGDQITIDSCLYTHENFNTGIFDTTTA
ncbi:MAG: hypothetical protein PF447_13065, partial [Spirochaetaceae bacterium]|nr:hypothetical protein [Spirochaetaceae bacterium]